MCYNFIWILNLKRISYHKIASLVGRFPLHSLFSLGSPRMKHACRMSLQFLLMPFRGLPCFRLFLCLFSTLPFFSLCLSCLCSLFLSGVRQDWCGHHNRFLFRAEGHTFVPFFFLLLSSYNPVSMWKPRMEGKLNFLWVQGDVTASLDSFTSWGKKKGWMCLLPQREHIENIL